MKKRLLLFLLTFLCMSTSVFAAKPIILEYDGAEHTYTGSVFRLMINDKFIETPLHPIIFNDFALVPIREVFEALGASVRYINDTKEILISYNKKDLYLQIGNPIAKFGEKEIEIPGGVVPKLIAPKGKSAKTMVPARFVAETLNMSVDFDEEYGVIKLGNKTTNTDKQENQNNQQSNDKNNQQTETLNQPTIVDYEYYMYDKKSIELEIKFDKSIDSITEPILTNSNVLYVDVPGTKYSISNSIEVNTAAISKIRLGMHEEYTRIALDLFDITDCDVRLANNNKIIIFTINFNPKNLPDTALGKDDINSEDNSKDNVSSEENKNEENNTEDSDDNSDIIIPELIGEKIVVIDAGHGGKDPGTHADVVEPLPEDSTETPKTTTYNEKDINLEMAHLVTKILKNNGINVIMTRDDDTYLSLSERSEIANLNKAVMFVSIHSNSSTNTSASGYDVYYSELNNDNDTGLSSKDFAKDVIDEIAKKVDTRKRGIKTADHVVTRTSIMPAILIEVGFMSNPEELQLLLSDEFKENFAQGIANGIIKSIKNAQIPEIIEPEPAEVQEIIITDN